jgi:single-stranded-DNA-specific exonuclease
LIVDHHEFAGTRPDCTALVNPKCGDSFHYLCSAGLAFKLAHALLKHSPLPGFDLKELLDIVAVATLADLVPLVEENRILVRHGLRQLENTRWPGLVALMQVSGVHPPISSSDVGFRLGPRINAAGRVGTARESLELLLTNDPREAATLAASLDAQNRERQSVERQVVRDVESWIEAHCRPDEHASIVAGDRDWHEGVLGIVASRIMRRYHRPTLIVGFQEDGSGKGSGRSIEGLSLVEALGRCARHLDRFGGHEMAAGLTLQENRFEDFRQAFEEAARELLDAEMLTPSVRLDAELDLEDIDFHALEEQSQLEPYGMGNRQPLLLVRGIAPIMEPRVMKEKHLRLCFGGGRRRVNAVFFDGATSPLPRPPWDVAFRLERNEYNGRVEPQMHIVALRHAEP